MKYNSLREELKQYYWYEADKKADDFADECFKILDNSDWEKMNPYQMKIFQYKTITEMFEPVIFDNSPFYFENYFVKLFASLCTMTSCSFTCGSTTSCFLRLHQKSDFAITFFY